MGQAKKIEQDINIIRLSIYEETKHLTAAQRADRTNKIAQAAAEKYGFTIIKRAKETGSHVSPSR